MTALATTQQTLSAQTAKDLGITSGYLQLVKDVYAKNATDEELALFLRTAHRLGLDPTARQIYLVKRWDSSLKREVATPQTSIDGFRLIADRTDKYVPGRESTFTYRGEQLESATAYIKKYAGREWHEISATAFYAEYVQKTKEGKPNSMWQKMPHLMLAKCAESLVLRKAFPAELSGIYTSEEMGGAHDEPPRQPTKGELIAAAIQEQGEVVDAEWIEPHKPAESFMDAVLDATAPTPEQRQAIEADEPKSVDSQMADLVAACVDKINELTNGEARKVQELMNGRVLKQMDLKQLSAFYEELQKKSA